ncbi:hydroxypyruvate isomerase [Bradyrhizobium sp. BR13661]|jgi:hydroxypyruvate isomerase|uniref:hydroxypyruvate isomerase n=1 Tax=Bradyrhizobium sp. BR13661 TaxID=2940622 RepID=UPI002475F840|nr:hydroxypyruvate isomerase [Bradyrhizobium sp. BR13661]MDH6257573.1 hydroxypyruvate isomerase [Bradyrhizobium sp. BR13661]
MPKLAANISMLFTEVAFEERFAAAAEAGFRGVEYLFPYAVPKEEIADLLSSNNLTQVLFNLPAGNWAAGERGIGCHPDRVGEFQDGVGQAIEYALALGCKQVNCLAGIVPNGLDVAAARRTLVENLRFAATKLKAADVLLIAEPINTYDIPGFFLNGSAQAVALFDEVGSDNLKLQYDIYHMQRMEGELARTMERLLPRIGHIQLADNPGRNEPGTGEINYPYLFGFLERLGYGGWIGCEYKPLTTTSAGLSWREGQGARS